MWTTQEQEIYDKQVALRVYFPQNKLIWIKMYLKSELNNNLRRDFTEENQKLRNGKKITDII